jgi:hypothetical protein
MARVLSKIPKGKIKSFVVSQKEKLSQQRYEKEKARKAANVAQYEKEKAARATVGSRYGYDAMGGNARTLNTNTRARTYREFLEISEAKFVYGGEKKEPEDTRMTVTAADKKANTLAWKNYQAGHKGYKAAPHLTQEAISASDRKLAQSGILSKRADELQSEIDTVQGKKKPEAPNRSAKRIPTKQDYQVKEESAIVKQEAPPTPEEKRKIVLMQKLARLKAAAKGSPMVSDVSTKEEFEIDEAKVDEKLPEYKRSAARLSRYDNPSGALALGGGQQRARRAEHEARRGVKKSKV